MIRANEIRETAREHGVPETTIEKDYCISWILNSNWWKNGSIFNGNLQARIFVSVSNIAALLTALTAFEEIVIAPSGAKVKLLQ